MSFLRTLAVANPWDPDVFGETLTLIGGIVLAAALLALIIFAALTRKKSPASTREIAFAGITLALSFALSYVRLFSLPQGGTVTLASILPICLYAYFFGFKRGLLVTFVYSILQLIQEPYIVHPVQLFLDYPLAFMSFSLVGLAAWAQKRFGGNRIVWLGIGIAVSCAVRYLFHVLSGAIFFGYYASAGQSAWAYSLGYNSFVFVDMAIALVLAVPLMLNKGFVRQLEVYKTKSEPTAEEPAAADDGTP